MLTAGDLLMTLSDRVDEKAGALGTVKALFQSEKGVLGLQRDGRVTGIITCYSALKAAAAKPLEELVAAELILTDCPAVQLDTPIVSLVNELEQKGALPVRDDHHEICGAVTTGAIEREIDAIINFSSDEIFVADGQGTVLRANAVFEDNFGIKVSEVIGKNVDELEQKNIFHPSVTMLVLKEKCTQSVIQHQMDGRKLLTTGTPAFNPDGSVFRVVVNARDITRLNQLKQQLEETELLKNRYYQELLELSQGSAVSEKILVSSPLMRELIRTVKKIASVYSIVLLTGESGVGKNLIARLIHDSSPRRDKPFTTINCGAIPENLLESELFGYAGGAFTGAKRGGKIGKIEMASGGTLFLDEITEMPLNLQVKLLHVIQEGVITRIGDNREIQLDLRIIAATNRDIVQLVREGKFRDDLYYRLNVIPLEIPPLRRRPGDIEPLARRFLGRFNQQYCKQKQFAPEVFEFLRAYRWPGNVRELENLIERLVIVVDDDIIGVRHLPHYITGKAKPPAGINVPSTTVQPLKMAKEKLERELLEEALLQCRTTYEIASLLHVDQSTVVRKLKKYKLSCN